MRVLIAVVAGLVAAASPAAPTGSPAIDAVLVGVTVAAVTWLGAGDRRVASAALLVAGVVSWSWIGLGVAVVVATVCYLLAGRPTWADAIDMVLVGAAMNLLARSELPGFVGASTLIAVLVGAVVAGAGLTRRSRHERRIAAAVVGAALGVALVGTVAFGVSALRSADDLRSGDAAADRGLDALRTGDIDEARRAFEESEAALSRANSRLGNPVNAVAAIVPGVAQHRRVATTLSQEATESAATIVEQLADLDPSDLRVVDGRIDIDRVREIGPALTAIDAQVRELRSAITDTDSPWLVAPVTDRLDRLATRLDSHLERNADAIAAAHVAPAILGGDDERVYFVGFTTPAEARGLGGFMGNWAEVTVTDGRLEVTATGRSDDLDFNGVENRRFDSDEPAFGDWLRRYGPYNLTSGPNGTTGPEPFKNIVMSPDMEMTGRAIAELYPQSGGQPLDGVVILDVYALSQFLTFTGPIPFAVEDADGGQVLITPENSRRFLLNEQYDETDRSERADALGAFADEVIDRLLGGALPPVDELVDEVAPMVRQGRLTAWLTDPDEQAVVRNLGMAGTLPVADDDDAIAVAFNNAAGSKIDFYLRSEASYDVVADGQTGQVASTLTVSMTNEAPAAGEPPFVIGNLVGLPDGTNRTWVSVFTRLPVSEVLINGQPALTEIGSEAGYFVTSVFVRLDAGATAELTLTMDGPLDVTDGYTLDLRSPPIVRHMPHTIDATWIDSDGVEHHTTEQFDEAGLHRVTVPTDD